MAEDEGCTTNALITTFHVEIFEHRGEIPNFASFLRVSCIRYLRRNMINLEKKLDASQEISAKEEADKLQDRLSEGTGTYPGSTAGLLNKVLSIKR